jgi:hypothetical protein
MNPISNNNNNNNNIPHVVHKPMAQPASKKPLNIIEITKECDLAIKELKRRNLELEPSKFKHPRLLTFLTVASLIAIVVGPILALAGTALCLTGFSLPAGLALIGVGVGLLAAGIPLLTFCHGKIKIKMQINENQKKITLLKRVKTDIPFTKYAHKLCRQRGIQHISIPAFIYRFDIEKIYHLREIYKKEAAKTPQRVESQGLIYNAFLDLAAAKINLTNRILKEANDEIQSINDIVKKNPEKKAELEKQKNILLARGRRLKLKRAKIFKSAPKEKPVAVWQRDQCLKREAQRSFPLLRG